MRRVTCLILVAFTIFCADLFGQDEVPTRVTNQNRTGDLPFASTIGTGIETVDLASGTLNVKIPIVSVPGRGMNSELFLRFNSNMFVVGRRVSGLDSGYELWNEEQDSGWQKNFTKVISSWQQRKCDDFGHTSEYGNWHSNYIYTDPSGGKHPLAIQWTLGYCSGPGDPINPDLGAEGMQGTAGGNSSIKLADGTKITTGNWTDSNGNTKGDWTDTLGRNLYSVVTTTDPVTSQPVQDVYTVYDAGATARTYTVNWQRIQVNTLFNSGPRELNQSSFSNGYYRNVISSIVLPNGRSYSFTYDAGAYGEITRIDFPTGGYVTYQYSNYVDMIEPTNTRRYVSNRTEYAGGQSASWSINLQSNGGGTISTVTFPMTALYPSGTQSTFASIDGAVTDAKIYAGTAQGTPLREYKIDYVGDANPFVDPCYDDSIFPNPPPSQTAGLRPIRITTILEDGRQSKKEFDYETFSYTYHPGHCTLLDLSSAAQTYTTSRGNVTEIREYDFGAGAPGRKTTRTYQHNSFPAYLTANIVNKILAETILDANGVQKAQTTYEYDSTAITSTNGGQNNPPNHDYTNFSSTFTTRGNATKVKRWRNTDGALLTTSYVYDDLGNIRSITDPLNHATTWSYTDNWYGSGCLPATNSLAYVTQITNAAGHIVQLKRFPCTGQLQARTDANNQTTTFTYDLMNRPDITNFPDCIQSVCGQTDIDYDDTNRWVRTQRLREAGVYMIAYSYFDDLGRTWRQQLCEDATTGCAQSINTDTTFDSLGRVMTVSNPYRPGDTVVSTTTAYDALNRVATVTRQDGSTASTTYAGNSTTITDEAGKQRRSYSDALGRLIQIDEPNGALVQATAGQGNFSIIGALQSTNVNNPGTSGTGSVTISGSQHQEELCNPTCHWVYDSGTVQVWVNGVLKTVSYASSASVTATTVATALRNAIHNDTAYPVDATGTGTLVTLTARTVGTSTNYTLSTAVTSNNPGLFSPPVFAAARSGSALTGGTDAFNGTIWDAGTITATIGGHATPVGYGQPNTTASATTTALANAINADSAALATATANGSSITLTSRITGASSNYSWSVGATTSQSQYFAQPSFSASPTSGALSGGTNASGGLATPLTTLYSYDTLDNLTCVEQHGNVAGTGCASDPSLDATSPWRVRRFSYNSLSQLSSAKNPESGTIGYTYYDDGTVNVRTDARGVTTTYAYDTLHRITSKTYSNQTPAYFTYDLASTNGVTLTNAVGRLIKATDFQSQTIFSYDPMGRSVVEYQCTPVQCPLGSWVLTYSYNFVGSVLTKKNYVQGPYTLTYHYDLAGRVDQVKSDWIDVQHPQYLANGIQYTAAGAISQLDYGNGLRETRTFNQRLQPTELKVFDPANPTVSVLKQNYTFPAANNGNLSRWEASSAGNQLTFTRDYTYDYLNRLSTMSSVPCSLSWNYDSWGNRLNQSLTGGGCLVSSSQVNVLNHVSDTGYVYDASGNMTNEPGASYAYNAENQMTSFNNGGTTYLYDILGKRVRKQSGTAQTNYFYYNDGQVATEINESRAVGATYVHLNGQILAEYKNTTTYFAHLDHLGSTRMLTKMDKSVGPEAYDYQPFGEQTLTGSVTTKRFSGKERDAESGLDYFGERYYSSAMGRFTATDSGPFIFHSPQSYNAYTYALNNPLRYSDDDGLTAQDRVNAANKFLSQNIPYVFGGKDPSCGLDCSGLVQNVFKADPDNNISLRTNAAGQAAAFQTQGEFSTDINDAKPGDAIFWSDSAGNIVHTGIVVDIRDGTIYFVHAPGAGRKVTKFYVKVKNPNLGKEKFSGVGRPMENNSSHPRAAVQNYFSSAMRFFYTLFPSFSPPESDPEGPKKKTKQLPCLRHRGGPCL